MNGSEPVVSIITPTFNHERYIRRCLESSIAQTDPRWEQIIVDDGSDDETEAIIRSFDDPRIVYVRRSHLGIMYLAEAYNLALEMSRGAFVAVLEGDDFWPADKIERQLRLFDRPEIVLTWGRIGVTNEVGEVQRTEPSPAVVARMQGQTPGDTARALVRTNFIPANTVMCRRDALVSVGGFQQPAGIPTTDYPTWLALCRIGSFASVNEVLGFHREHQDQVSVQRKVEMDSVLDWGTRFVERLPVDERDAMGLSLDETYEIERNRHGYLGYAAGRAALANNDVVLARPRFRQAVRDGTGATRLKGLLGLTCSYLGLDLERMASVTSRVRGG